MRAAGEQVRPVRQSVLPASWALLAGWAERRRILPGKTAFAAGTALAPKRTERSSMRLLRQTVTAFWLLVMVAGPSLGATSPDPAAVAACPEYGAHLARAETALAGGKRELALDALRAAAAALRQCEEGAEETGSLLG